MSAKMAEERDGRRARMVKVESDLLRLNLRVRLAVDLH
jgi:hypothetical protein